MSSETVSYKSSYEVREHWFVQTNMGKDDHNSRMEKATGATMSCLSLNDALLVIIHSSAPNATN
jgi:hypothetical protein